MIKNKQTPNQKYHIESNFSVFILKLSAFLYITFFTFLLSGTVLAANITISGTLYSDKGSTVVTSGETIKVAVGTSTASVHSATSDGSGNWSITDIDDTLLSSTTPFTVWLDGDTNDATTVVAGFSGGNITNVPLYYDYTIVYGVGSSDVLDASSLDFYDSTDDEDILYAVGNGSTTVSSNFLIEQGDFLAPTSTLKITGDYLNEDKFSKNSGTVSVESIISDFIVGFDVGADKTGTRVITMHDVEVNGNYLYIATGNHASGEGFCSSNPSACELQIYDISSSTNPVYVAGMEASGHLDDFASTAGFYDIHIVGDYLFAGKQYGSTACSQTAGEAFGCELQIYDISSSTNPVYVAGMDSSGSSDGTGTFRNGQAIAVKGNYLYFGKSNGGSACSQTAGSATDCELMVFDISSTTNPVYVAGRDVDGSADGTSSFPINDLKIVGNTLYVAVSAHFTACSQTAGEAFGCELQIYDISSSTNPVYVGGRDEDGSANGRGNAAAMSIDVFGDYLYLGKTNYSVACSQTAGSARGCELIVFDISSTTNPVYVAGRDADGSSSGTGNVSILKVFVDGGKLYVGKGGNSTACSQTAGSASGCEFMVFDIASSSNPIYELGIDGGGSADGTADIDLNAIALGDKNLYLGKERDSTACSQTVGSSIGCELLIYKASSEISGNLTGTNNFNSLNVKGKAAINDIASTTDLTISTSSTLVAPSHITVSGDFTNNGTFTHNNGLLTLDGSGQSLISQATTTFYTLTKESASTDTLTFTAGGTYVIEDRLTLTGEASNLLSLRSDNPGTQWYINPATTTVSYIDVKDSNNINVTTISCASGCVDSGNNTNWSIAGGDPITFSSSNNYDFYVGQATTTLDSINITKLESDSDITAANDLRIAIATSTTNFRFNENTTSLTFSGSASGKVNSTVSYEDDAATLVVDVTSDFVKDEVLTIDGIQVGSFLAVSTSSSQFSLHTDGVVDDTPIVVDDKNIDITGSLAMDDHTTGQVEDKFSFQNKTNEPFFAFMLVPSNENATITDMVFTLSGVNGVDPDEFDNFKLYSDENSDGELDGGDTLLDGFGIMTLNGQHGAITFSSDFLATTTKDYLLVADTSSIDRDDMLTIDLLDTGITSVGGTSGKELSVIGGVNNIQHIRGGAAGGGGTYAVGGSSPAGRSVESGGGSDADDEVGQEDDGENIAYNQHFFKPTATGDIDNEWTDPGNAFDSDGVYATAASALKQSYNGFDFGIPNTNTIEGIAVKIDASGSTADGTIDVSLSWDGGSSYTTAKATPTFGDTDIVYTVGNESDTWGRTWSASEFDLSNFRLRVTASPASNTINLDALEIRVYHQTGGGGSGGGGSI